MEKPEPIWPDGLMFKRPREGAPDFVKGSLSVNVKKFQEFMKKYQNNEWLNFDLKVSRQGQKLYLQLNTYNMAGVEKKSTLSAPIEYPTETINIEDVPW